MAGFPNPNRGSQKNGNGKRERVDQEDDQEFMPLSKRINNIHLSPERLLMPPPSATGDSSRAMNGHASTSNGMMNGFHHQDEVALKPHPAFPGDAGNVNGYPQRLQDPHRSDFTPCNGTLPPGIGNSSMNSVGHDMFHRLPPRPHVPELPIAPVDNSPEVQYRPLLSQTANPHYYEANRALFNLYIERQIRNNHVLHPNVYNRTVQDSNNRL